MASINTASINFEDEPRSGLPFDRIGLVLGPVVLVGWLTLHDRGSLNSQAHTLAGILMMTILWWVTEPIPIPATGLLAVMLAIFLDAVPVGSAGSLQAAKVAFAPFGEPTVFFLIGGMFIGCAMTRHGLDRRLALGILTTRWAGRSPNTVLLAVGLSVMLVSMWISNTAATAMVYPVTMGVIGVLGGGNTPAGREFGRSRYASALLLMTAYASTVGGIATPIGTTTNVVAMGFFRRPEYFNQPVDFARWTMVGGPMTLVLAIGLFFWLKLQAPAVGLDLPALRKFLQAERATLGRWKVGEINTLAVFLIVVGLWLTPALFSILELPWLVDTLHLDADRLAKLRIAFIARFPEEAVALLAPILLFLLPVSWRRREFSLTSSDFSKIDWGTMLLFGAGLSLGNLMFKSGLAEWLGQSTLDLLDTRDVWAITALSIAGAILLSEFTSNAATANTIIPVVWALCHKAGVDPLPPLMGATFGASFGSALPVSTPPNAIVYGSRLIPTRRMIFAGVGVDIMSGIVIWLVLRIAHAWGWTPLAGT